jgi:hypothetical protein
MKRRLLNLLIALDQFVFCVITLGYSDPDETISAAAWRWEQAGKWNGWLRPVIDALFWFDANHCYESHLKEISR